MTFLFETLQNAELFAMTYGALVVQLIQDYEDYAEVNKQLEKMGYNIGTRLIEDFLARSNIGRCTDFKETGEVVAKVKSHHSLFFFFLFLTSTRGCVIYTIGRFQVVLECDADRDACATSTTSLVAVKHACRTTSGRINANATTVLYSHDR
jgi:Transport protein particle (TRAPP) component